MEIVDQYYQGEWKEKAGFQYLLYTNEEDEKVALKFSNDELVMTRFSSPKSIMRFYKNEDGGAIIPTPMGIQQFFDYNRPLSIRSRSFASLLSLVNSRWRTGICQLSITSGMGRIDLIKLLEIPLALFYKNGIIKPLKGVAGGFPR